MLKDNSRPGSDGSEHHLQNESAAEMTEQGLDLQVETEALNVIADETPVVDSETRPDFASYAAQSRADDSASLQSPGSHRPLVCGRYELVGKLDWNTNSTLYRALDTRNIAFGIDPYVTILIPCERLVSDSATLSAWLARARAWQVLKHTNLVNVYECRRNDGRLMVVLELLKGQSLSQWLCRSTPSDTERAKLVLDFGRTLDFVHTLDHVHGSLTPNAISIDGVATPKLLCPGVSDLLPSAVDDLLADTSPYDLASNIYSSPETLRGTPPDRRSDVFSFACIAYEVLTGLHPFDRLTSVEAQDCGSRVRHAAPLTLRQWRAFKHALAFNPNRRARNIRTVLTTLECRSEKQIAGISIAALILEAAILFHTSPLRPQTPETAEHQAVDIHGNPRDITIAIEATRPDRTAGPTTEGGDFLPASSIESRESSVIAENADALPQETTPVPATDAQLPSSQVAAVTSVDTVHDFPSPPTAEQYASATADVPTDARIAELLSHAQEALASEQLLGSDDAAAETYRDVLRLSPGNQEAEQGLRTVTSILRKYARKAAHTEQWDNARAYLQAAQTIDPNDSLITTALEQVNEAQTTAEMESDNPDFQAPAESSEQFIP